ncbi:MAG TPA: hypothetical protein VGL56_12710 [Fimbriimonadaceae bacterium]
MNWLSRHKIAVYAYAILILPALIIPGFVHQRQAMMAWTCFAWIFCTPLAAFVGSLGKKRNLTFYAGVASLLVPVEVVWYLAYISNIAPPPREKIAELYMPIILISGMFLVPLGFYWTYIGTRPSNSDQAL